MKAQTYLNAYDRAMEDKAIAVASRKRRHWGIMVEKDYWARFYQRRNRQANKFLLALRQKLAELEQ